MMNKIKYKLKCNYISTCIIVGNYKYNLKSIKIIQGTQIATLEWILNVKKTDCCNVTKTSS